MSGGATELSPAAKARRAAGRALRRLGHALVGHHADEVLLTDVAATLDGLNERLERGEVRRRQVRFSYREATATAGGSRLESFDDRPFSGAASPWGLDLEVHRVGDGTDGTGHWAEVEAAVTLGAAHEGAPGRAHGGIVAGLFDDVFGFVLGVHRQPAFTGELKVRYVRPTPLHRPLLCRGRLVERSGRRLLLEGELVDANPEDRDGPGEGDEVVVARSTGLFVAVDPAMFVETMELPPPVGDD